MTTTSFRHLPASAEVARTLLDGLGSAAVSAPLDRDGSGVPALHAMLGTGELVLAAPRGTVRLPDGAEDCAVSLCVRAEASLADLTVPRAHLEVLGWARPATAGEMPAALQALSHGWPLDALGPQLGGRQVLVVEVAEAELHWVGGCVTLEGEQVRAASPDPLWRDEADLLDRLRALLTPRLLDLVRGLGTLAQPDGELVDLGRTRAVRPITVDRYGVSLRCETVDDRADPAAGTPAHHLLRIPFGRALSADEDAWAAITTEIVSQAACLAGCRRPQRPAPVSDR